MDWQKVIDRELWATLVLLAIAMFALWAMVIA
jgi:hypothetical protein